MSQGDLSQVFVQVGDCRDGNLSGRWIVYRPTRWLAIATLIRRCCSRTSGLENVIMCVCQVSVPNKRRKQNCSLIPLSHLCGSGRGYLRFCSYFFVAAEGCSCLAECLRFDCGQYGSFAAFAVYCGFL